MVGSSRKSVDGSWISASARSSRRFIPPEYVRILRSPAEVRPTRPSSLSISSLRRCTADPVQGRLQAQVLPAAQERVERRVLQGGADRRPAPWRPRAGRRSRRPSRARRWAGGGSSACAPWSISRRRSAPESRRSGRARSRCRCRRPPGLSLNERTSPSTSIPFWSRELLSRLISGNLSTAPAGRVRRATLEGASMTPTTDHRTTAAARGLGLVPPRARGDHPRALRAAAARARTDAERLRGAAPSLACRRGDAAPRRPRGAGAPDRVRHHAPARGARARGLRLQADVRLRRTRQLRAADRRGRREAVRARPGRTCAASTSSSPAATRARSLRPSPSCSRGCRRPARPASPPPPPCS